MITIDHASTRSPSTSRADASPPQPVITDMHGTQRLAQAIKVEPPSLDYRLRLSAAARYMVAAALQHPDPSLASRGIEAFVFNINGFEARNMAWLRNGNGRVVLLTPEDPRWPVREYPDLATMKDTISRMLNVGHGRDMIAAHFDMQEATYAWGWSLSTWLVQIPRHPGPYEYAIADYYRTPASDATLRLALAGTRLRDEGARPQDR